MIDLVTIQRHRWYNMISVAITVFGISWLIDFGISRYSDDKYFDIVGVHSNWIPQNQFSIRIMLESKFLFCISRFSRVE